MHVCTYEVTKFCGVAQQDFIFLNRNVIYRMVFYILGTRCGYELLVMSCRGNEMLEYPVMDFIMHTYRLYVLLYALQGGYLILSF